MYNLEKLALRSTTQDNLARLVNLLDEVIRPDWEKGPWVAGGSIRRLLMNEDPLGSDVDVFFASETQKDEWLSRVKAVYPEAVSFANANNVTLDCGDIKLQAVHIAYFASPEAVIDSFDYTICQLVTDGKTLAVGEYTLWDIARKRLALHRVTYAVATMRRMLKYARQGFYACPGMMNDLLRTVAENPSLINAELAYID